MNIGVQARPFATFAAHMARAAFADDLKPPDNDAILNKILASEDMKKITDGFQSKAYEEARSSLPPMPMVAQYRLMDVRLANGDFLIKLEIVAASSRGNYGGKQTLLATPDGKGGYRVKIAPDDFYENPKLVLKSDGKPCRSSDEAEGIINNANTLASATVTLPDTWKPLSEILYASPDKQFRHVIKASEIEKFKNDIRQWAAKNEAGTASVTYSLHPMEGNYKFSTSVFPEEGEFELERKRGLLCQVTLPGETPRTLAFLVLGDELIPSDHIIVRDIDGEKKELKDILLQSTKSLVREDYTYDANRPKQGFVKN